MSRFGYQTRNVIHDSTISSTYTSNPILIVDYASMSLSYVTNVASASTLTVWQSDDDGLTVALSEPSWSVVTSLTGKGLYTIDPGARWLRTTCPSLDSTTTIILQGWTG